MKASELVAELNRLIGKHGDLPVYHWNDWYDFPIKWAEFWESREDIVPGDHMARPGRIFLGPQGEEN